jgi:DNA-binding response OmpR family regulator
MFTSSAFVKKIEDDPATPRYIVTERGVGYRFEG